MDDLGLEVVDQQPHPDHTMLPCRVADPDDWCQDTTAAAASRVKLSTQAVVWALKTVVIDRMSTARITAGLGVSWNTVNDAVLATGHQLLIAESTRFAESTRQNTEPARR